MGTFANQLASRNRELSRAVDTQIFTYGYEVWVPQDGVHANEGTSQNQGGDEMWPGGPQVPLYPGDTPIYGVGPGGLNLHRGIATLLFQVENDAHFRIEAITASVYGLVDWGAGKNFQQQSGVKDTGSGGATTLFPFPGPKQLPAFLSLEPSKAERGVSVNIIDVSKDVRNLTSDYTPMECLFPPGYGVHIAEPFMSGYVLEKYHTLRFDFQNRDFRGTGNSPDPANDCYHVVKIAFTGTKFYTD
jgi:hypothetical protein